MRESKRKFLVRLTKLFTCTIKVLNLKFYYNLTIRSTDFLRSYNKNLLSISSYYNINCLLNMYDSESTHPIENFMNNSHNFTIITHQIFILDMSKVFLSISS